VKKPKTWAKMTAPVVNCPELTLRTLFKAVSGLTELARELALEVIVRGFRKTLIRGWK
jgi:hypothetical protein